MRSNSLVGSCHVECSGIEIATYLLPHLGKFGMLGTYQNRQHAVVTWWATTIFWWACAFAFDAGKRVVTCRIVLDLDVVLPTITRVASVYEVKPPLDHHTLWGCPFVNHQHAQFLICGSVLDLVDVEIVRQSSCKTPGVGIQSPRGSAEEAIGQEDPQA